MDEETRFWRHIEGEYAPDEQDADHWVRVYEELRATLGAIQRTGAGDPARVERLMAVFESRLAFWEGLRRDSAVRAARRRREQRGGDAGGSARHSA